MEYDDQFNIWLVFPEGQKGRMLGGLFLDQRSLVLRQGWFRGAIDPEQLCEKAKMASRTDQTSWSDCEQGFFRR